MKKWRAVYRFVFPHNTGRWRYKSFDTEAEAKRFLNDGEIFTSESGGKDARFEGKVQPSSFRLPRNINITFNGDIVKKNPSLKPRTTAERAKYLRRRRKQLHERTKQNEAFKRMRQRVGKVMTAWDILIDAPGGYKILDRVHFTSKMNGDEVRHTLIAHDHYPGNILVRKVRNMKKNPRTVIDPITRRRVRVKPIRQLAGGSVRPKRRNEGLRASDLSITRLHNGALEVAAMIGNQRVARTYYDYNRNEAIAAFKQENSMKKNPRRRSKKRPSPAQLAARKKFIKMVRARAKNRRKAARMKVTRHKRGTATRYKFSRPVTRAQAEAMIAQHKAPRRRRAMRRNPSQFILICVRRDGERWYPSRRDGFLTDNKRDASHFASEAGAMNYAKVRQSELRKLGFVRAHTERA